MSLSDEQKEMLKPGPDVKSQAAVTIPARLRPQSAEAPPPLPTVGRIVHFYCTEWERQGPWAAIVTAVVIHSEVDTPEIVATVSLTVAGMGHISIYHNAKEENRPWLDIIDVPGIIPGVEQPHIHWWCWPERT